MFWEVCEYEEESQAGDEFGKVGIMYWLVKRRKWARQACTSICVREGHFCENNELSRDILEMCISFRLETFYIST